MNLLMFCVIILVSAGLILISYYVFCDAVDERNYKQLQQVAERAAEFDDGYLETDLRDAVMSDEFMEVRTRAVEENNPDLIRDWMDQQSKEILDDGTTLSLSDEYDIMVIFLSDLKKHAEIKSLYLQYDRDGVTYNILDPDEDLLWVGSTEPPIKEFESYGNNDKIPPTIYRSQYGWLCTLCIPITNADTGEVVGYIGADMDMTEIIHDRRDYFLHSLYFVIILLVVSILVSTLLVQRMVSKPLRQLADATEHFSGGESGYSRDDIISLDIRARDEIGGLYHEIRSMQERIVDYTDHLTKITAEEERTKTELRTAATIQEAMLPKVQKALSDREEFELYASMTPAKEVGGDFYDFFMIDSNHLALVIADVSGKGVPASLFMMASKILLNHCIKQGGSPSEILQMVNKEICETNPTSMFVTVWLGILELSTGHLTCSNAGHEYPALRQNGHFSIVEDSHSPVLGARAKIKFKEYDLQLQPGDAIFIYTDGVPEARNGDKAFYGMERLEQILNHAVNNSPQEILQMVEADVNSFCDGAEQFDDLTMLCLEYKGMNG